MSCERTRLASQRLLRRLFVLGLIVVAAPQVLAAGPATPFTWVESSALAPEMSSALRIFLTLTALSFLPALLICTTAFIRIVIVLSMLRHALGLMETPPNVVVITLALFLTLFAMQPVIRQVDQTALQPYMQGKTSLPQAAAEGVKPLKAFMVRHTREQDLMLMVETAGAPRPTSIDEIDLWHLVPAFMLSELRVAFLIGFTIFLPFLLVDLVVASVLMALGMMMVPPATIAIPLKLLLFVLIDGWHIVTRALLGSLH
jgi:flagellar biosynthetic protein FliP